MKKLLFILLLCPIFTFSQKKDTTKTQPDTIKVPTHAAKSIVKELISCDSLKAIHKVTVEELDLTKQKVNIQGEIVKSLETKGTMYEQRIANEQEKFKVQGQWLEDIRKENKRLKVKIRFMQIAGAAIGGVLTYLYITK
jgi:hypothetical protein